MDISSQNPHIHRVETPAVELSRNKNTTHVQAHSVKPINASASTPVVMANHAISFQSDDVSGQDYFVVKDKNTDEVIKQYPPEEMIKVARHLLMENGHIFKKEV